MSVNQKNQLEIFLNMLDSGRKLSKKQQQSFDRIKVAMTDQEQNHYDIYSY